MRLTTTSLALAAILASSAISRADPPQIRVGWVAPVANFASILLLKPELMTNQGKTYDFEPQHFASTPTMIPALAAGDLDIATISYAAFATAIENAGMEDLRVLADEFQDGVDGYYSDELMVLKDSPIKTVDDLKGKVASTNGAGGAIDVALRVMLKKHGLADKRDVTLIEIGLPNERAALAEHKVDLITSAIPFSQDPALRSIARTLFTQKDALGPSEMIFWASRTGFIAKNRAALVDFLADTIRARRFYMDPAHHAEAVRLAADFSKQPPESLDSWLFTKTGDYYRDPDDLPNMKALQANLDTQHEEGFLKATLDVGKYADLTVVQDALKKVRASDGSKQR
ncbi:MAG TPA: ABC transporter substrate-binding protein [Stellaceae bacterium]|nr:ABC transporter substrate-binding protein [Stellaceae bacterium]